MSSKVLLVGAFGQANPGDDALCDVFCTALADHEIVVASDDPAASASRHGTRTIAASALPAARAVREVDAVVVGGVWCSPPSG